MDCDSQNKYAAGGDCGLALRLFGGFLVEGLFLFDRNVAKLCGIKDFPAGLAFNKFSVFLTGDDLDDGMFAKCCHLGEENRMVRILPVSGELVNWDLCRFFVKKCW